MDKKFLFEQQLQRVRSSNSEIRLARKSTSGSTFSSQQPSPLQRWEDPDLFNFNSPQQQHDSLHFEAIGNQLDLHLLKQPKSKINNHQKYNILLTSDFVFPKFGGVETHVYQVAQCLIERGHKVCFLTNMFNGTRSGVRTMANGLKVYHIPQVPFCQENVAFLTFFNSLPIIRQILIREQIDIVHGHQSVSILQNIVLMTAKSLGVKTVFTEHSLFTYHQSFAVHVNKLLKWSFADLDAAICVSNACKDNFVLRAKINPQKTFTIPNAVDYNKFTPNFAIREKELENNPEQINIVFISRLQYRKGIDLLIPIIPKILAKFENVHFIIGGDGPGMSDLKVLVEKHNLHSRVELLGSLPHDQVRDVLCRGHIFLNTSLTESFCIAILEAACCGLLVVSTDVGGVPEVLPPHMAYLARPEEKSILRQLCQAVKDVKHIKTDTFNQELSEIYSWRNVAERTEKVYDYVMRTTHPNVLDRLKTAYTWGSIAGFLAVFHLIFESILMMILDIFWPEEDIDIVRNFDSQMYNQNTNLYGNHHFCVDTKDTRHQVHQCNQIIIDNTYSNEKDRLTTINHNRRFKTLKPSKDGQQIWQQNKAIEDNDICSCQKKINKPDLQEQSIQTLPLTEVPVSEVVPTDLPSKEIPIIQSQQEVRYSTPDNKKNSTQQQKPEISTPDSLSSLDTVDTIIELTPEAKKPQVEIKLESAPLMKHFLSHDSQMQVE